MCVVKFLTSKQRIESYESKFNVGLAVLFVLFRFSLSFFIFLVVLFITESEILKCLFIVEL